MPGLFITLEGVDGAGKSTHLAAMQAWLSARGRPPLMTREPGGTPLAERVRELVLHEPMDMLSEALLVFAARRDHVQHCIRPALARGQTVLCDRFTDASFAYQGGGRGLDLEVLQRLEHWVHGDLQPDLTLWFVLDPAEAERRRASARSPDRFEQQDVGFFERVHAGYEARAREAPQRYVRIDAAAAPDAVWQQVQAAMAQRIPPA
jgi:dTMP kinase